MRKQKINDMTKGSPFRLIVLFSIPLFLGNAFQQLYNMADTLIVGRYLGMRALAALGATGSLAFLLFGLANGLTSGFAVIVSQKFGAEDYDEMRHSVATSILLSFALSIVITGGLLLGLTPLLRLMQTPADIFDDAVLYISIIFAGTIASVFYNMFSGILRALGDSRTPLYFLILSSMVNIVLDIVFISSFGMGVEGAAYATIISQGLSAVLCLVYIKIKYPILALKKEDWRIDLPFAWRHLRIGIPMALQFSVTAVGVMVMQTALNALGSTVVASYTAASKVEQIITMPAMTFGMAMAVYCGQNMGAERYDRIKSGVRSCTILSCAVSIVCSVVTVLFGGQMTRLFLDQANEEVLSYAVQYLNLIAIFFIPLHLIFIYRNALQGMGHGFMPMMAGVFEFVARTVVAFTLPHALGYLGICIANPAAWIAAAVPQLITYVVIIRRYCAAAVLPGEEE